MTEDLDREWRFWVLVIVLMPAILVTSAGSWLRDAWNEGRA